MGDRFTYTYAPRKNAEVEEIRRKYAPASVPDQRLERLKQLDKKCERPGMYVSILVGIIGTALFSAGMLFIFGMQKYFIGVFVIAAGLCIMGLALPVYSVITEKRRKQYAPEIIRLSEEIEKDPSV